MSNLNAKQRIFVAEYLTDRNATQAAIRAGYSERSARNQGQRMMHNDDIRRLIEEETAKRLEALGVRADRVLEELARMGFSNMLEYMNVTADGDAYVDLSALTPAQAAAIQEVTVDDYWEGRGDDARMVKRIRVKLADKKAPLELLGKHLQLFTDRVEHSGPKGGPIQHESTEDVRYLIEWDERPLEPLRDQHGEDYASPNGDH